MYWTPAKMLLLADVNEYSFTIAVVMLYGDIDLGQQWLK